MPMRIFLICILFFTTSFNGFAQKTILYDTSLIQVREYSAEKLSAFKKDPHFQYERVIESPKSLWDRFWDWFWSLFEKLFGSKNGNRVFNWIIVSLAVVVIVFFIIKLTGMTNVGLFGKKNKGERLDYTTMTEDIHSINFDEEIQKAIDEKNFRLAVRLLYLQSLKKLSDNENINWQLNKTNLAYWQELGGTPYQQPFFELTQKFEYNWYGNRAATEEEFGILRQSFNDFNRQLN
jgi:hypothetical protein